MQEPIDDDRRLRVLIAGGGVAGLEALLALHALAAERTEVALLSPAETFEYRPLLVAGVGLRASSAASHVEGKELHLREGDPLPIDRAVALPRREAPDLPGLPQREHGFV